MWEPPASAAAGLVTAIGHVRGALVCGPGTDLAAVEPITALAAATGWPILAEPTSGLRCGAHDRTHVIAHYDVLLRDEDWAAQHLPRSCPYRRHAHLEAAARLARAQPSRSCSTRMLTWHEPTRTAQWIAAADPRADVLRTSRRRSPCPQPELARGWRAADELVAPALADAADPLEPKMWAALATSLPEAATVWVSSSMPIRDVETFFPSCPTRSAFSRTAAPTGSTASCRRPRAPRSPPAGARGS